MDTVSIFILVLFSLTLLVPLLCIKKALILYVIGTFIFPYLHVGGLVIRFELIYALWLFAVLLAKTMIKRTSVHVPQTPVLYSMWFMVVLISTLIAYGQHGGQLTGILITLNGLLRPLLVLLVFANAPIDLKFVRSTMWVFLVLSLGINLFSVVQILGVDAAPKITEQFYLSPAISAPFESLMTAYGKLARPMSVFESPVFNAVYTLIVMLMCLNMLHIEKNVRLRRLLYVIGVLAVVVGIITLSATFLVGIVIVIGIVVWQNIRFPQRFFRVARYAAVICIVALSVFWFSPTLQEVARGGLAFQIQRITTLKLFASRYAPEEGALASMYAVILENPIIGVGATRGKDVFVGDSFYVVVLYRGGLVGLASYLFLFYWVAKRNASKKNLPGIFGFSSSLVFQMTLLLLALGLGVSSFHVRRVSEWYWVLLGMSTNRSLRESADR